MTGSEDRFLEIVLADGTVRAILEQDAGGSPRVYAPYGEDDLFGLLVRPHRRQAPRHVYEAKAARWRQHWPELTVLDWADRAGIDGTAS